MHTIDAHSIDTSLPRVVQTFSDKIRKLPRAGTTHPQDYLTGGFVRDLLLHRAPVDIDIEVYGVLPRRLHQLIQSHFKRGAIEHFSVFGVWKVLHNNHEITYSLPRTETKTGTGHKQFTAHLDPFLTKRQAVQRRDFTVNALLMSPRTGHLFDSVGGLRDLHAHILRAVNPHTFADDPLRAWRAVELAGRLPAALEPHTQSLLKMMVQQPDMQALSGVRIQQELSKLFLYGEQPSHGLRLAGRLGLLTTVPELNHLYRRGTIWTKLMGNIDSIPINQPLTLTARWQTIQKALPHTLRQALQHRLNIPNKLKP